MIQTDVDDSAGGDQLCHNSKRSLGAPRMMQHAKGVHHIKLLIVTERKAQDVSLNELRPSEDGERRRRIPGGGER